MPLADHLRELRSRVFRSVLGILAGAVLAWIYYDAIFSWISRPFMSVVEEAQSAGRNVQLALTGVADPFVLQLQVVIVAGIVVSSPIWLYQT